MRGRTAKSLFTFSFLLFDRRPGGSADLRHGVPTAHMGAYPRLSHSSRRCFSLFTVVFHRLYLQKDWPAVHVNTWLHVTGLAFIIVGLGLSFLRNDPAGAQPLRRPGFAGAGAGRRIQILPKPPGPGLRGLYRRVYPSLAFRLCPWMGSPLPGIDPHDGAHRRRTSAACLRPGLFGLLPASAPVSALEVLAGDEST